MDQQKIIIIVAGVIALLSLAGMLYVFLSSRRNSAVSNLFQSSRLDSTFASSGAVRERLQGDAEGGEFEKVKKIARARWRKRKKVIPLEERFFHAGIFSARDKREFERLRYLAPIVLSPLLGGVALFITGDNQIALYGIIIGLFIGLKLPTSIIDRRVARRDEDIMFFLPLFIEQVAIGVSSSLDIGPCLQRITAMADERDSHNVVTELVQHAQYQIKSGVSLEEALVEIGIKSGHTELKHAFMALAQVAKHGGEISRQLQELADAVASQRETKIEAKIKKLELHATGPVALVFLGFILILLVGFFIQIKTNLA